MELIIVRHALPESEKRDNGPAAPPLTSLGLRQAEATADLLAAEGVDHVVTSTMQRAIQTGRPLADRLGLTPECLEGLKESDHRRSSYTPVEEMDAGHEVVREFLDDPLSMFADGYEAFRDRVTVTLEFSHAEGDLALSILNSSNREVGSCLLYTSPSPRDS